MTPVTVFDVIRRLPDPTALRDRSRALAMLDAIMSPDDWVSRYYSFDTRWAPGEDMASMRNGSGNDYFIVFSAAGTYARGWDHESPMHRTPGPWPGVLDSVPPSLAAHVTEPAFCHPDGSPQATVCFWRETHDDAWRCGDVAPTPDGREPADGADRLFRLLVDTTPQAYREFAEDYYETAVDLDAVRRVCALEPLTGDLVALLNPDAELRDVADDQAQIGYP
ncbi:hypothetical protein [Yinghuangia sp. YIM S09857]|uniref:hypothetical protein n=1 Tax=Yinghuangia sp. YIM S09857 TaxID=3436929 RepID=UPI003F531AFD